MVVIGVNFAWEDACIRSLGTYKYTFIPPENSYSNHFWINKPGEKPGTFYLYQQIYDDNGDPITDISDNNEQRVTGKSAIPAFHIGINSLLTYKNWDFSISGHGAFGQYLYNNLDAFCLRSAGYYLSNILEKNINTRFFPEPFHPSDYFLENASYFKIDNITVGYTLSRTLEHKLQFADCFQHTELSNNYRIQRF